MRPSPTSLPPILLRSVNLFAKPRLAPLHKPLQVANMHAAQVQAWSEGPKLVTVPDPPAPAEGEYRLKLVATGLHRVVGLRASGAHYSARSLPHTLGIDGVGLDESTGKQYFFTNWAATFGSFAEYINIAKVQCVELPASADGPAIAAFNNPAMSSWLALSKRTSGLPKDFTALIIGVTSASGALAVQIARAFGAARIIGAARNVEAARQVEGGVDEVIAMKGADTDFSKVECDVVLDYVYGDVTAALFRTLPTPRPVQFVQIGALSNTMEIPFDAAWLRGKNFTLRGSGPGAFSVQDGKDEAVPLLNKMVQMRLPAPTQVKLADFDKVWKDQAALGKGRIVFVP